MAVQIITANNLRNGEVVYLSLGAKWTENISEALGVESEDALEGMLATAEMAEKNQQVVGIYTLEVTRNDKALIPLSVKERIRSLGPTTRLDLGKQAYA